MSIRGTFRHENSSLSHGICGEFQTNREINPTKRAKREQQAPKIRQIMDIFRDKKKEPIILKNKLLFQCPRVKASVFLLNSFWA